MEFRHLESFLAIAEELHFGRAAARLHLAQPSLSHHLQQLERSVGVRLVDRGSHHVRLTPAGVAFRTEADRIVGHATRAVEVARAAARGKSGTVNIGYNFAAGHTVLPPTLSRLAADHPTVQPQLAERRSGPQLDGLLSEELDVGFVYGRPHSPLLASRELVGLPMAAVVGPRHPWAHRTSVAVSELGEYPCVLFRRWQSPAMYDAILHAAEQGGAELTVAEEVDDRWHTRMVIRSRPLVAFGSAASGARAAGEGVVALPLTGPAPRLRLHVAWRADDTSAPVTALLDSLAATGPFTAA